MRGYRTGAFHLTMSLNEDTSRYITRHVTYRLPVIGRIAREVVEGEVDNSFALIIMVVSAVASAVLIWGFPALIISALGATALMFLTLLRITFG